MTVDTPYTPVGDPPALFARWYRLTWPESCGDDRVGKNWHRIEDEARDFWREAEAAHQPVRGDQAADLLGVAVHALRDVADGIPDPGISARSALNIIERRQGGDSRWVLVPSSGAETQGGSGPYRPADTSRNARSIPVQATKGRTVLYKLSAADALAIGRARAFGKVEGNTVAEGDTYPATVVEDWGGGDLVNLKVHLDGHDDFWATSRMEGGEPGRWAWPVIKAPGPKTASLGLPVHYTSHGSPVRPDGTQAYQSVCRAAYITGFGMKETREPDGSISVKPAECLMVANPTGLFFDMAVEQHEGDITAGSDEPTAVLYRGGTWHHADHA